MENFRTMPLMSNPLFCKIMKIAKHMQHPKAVFRKRIGFVDSIFAKVETISMHRINLHAETKAQSECPWVHCGNIVVINAIPNIIVKIAIPDFMKGHPVLE